MGRFFTLTNQDLNIVEQQRSDHNRLGFALQLCTLRYLGFIPNNLLDPPQAVVNLLAYQLKVSAAAIKAYGEREQTRSDHLGQIIDYLGHGRASPLDLTQLEAWLVVLQRSHDQPTFLLHTSLERLRWSDLWS